MGLLLGLTGGLANGLLTAALPQIQGALGLTPAEGGWLSAAYYMTSLCMSLLVIKFRQQFGLQRFIRVFLSAFLVLMIIQVFVHSFAMELLVRGSAGVVASALTTLSFLYIMQSLPAAIRTSGFVIGFGLQQIALPLARVIAPLLLSNGFIQNLFVFELGLTLMALGAVALLRLPPSQRIDAFEPLDFLTFALFAPGVALLSAVLVEGRIIWWSTPWLGYATAAAIPLIGAALLIEHNRANPLLNTRWLTSSSIVRLALIVVAVRILLTEQSFGSISLLGIEGMGNDQLIGLNVVVVLASIAGLVTSLIVMKPTNVVIHVPIAAAIIAVGALIDARATNLTRPADLYLSQALIGFAALYSLGPTIMVGMWRALSKGPTHLVSFSALLGLTQSMGSLAGNALLGSVQILREKFHSYQLSQSLVPTDPQVVNRVQTLGGAYSRVLGDPALRSAEGSALLSQQVTREANILAYNDVFLMIAILAVIVVLWLGSRTLYYRVRRIDPFAEDLATIGERVRQAQSQ